MERDLAKTPRRRDISGVSLCPLLQLVLAAFDSVQQYSPLVTAKPKLWTGWVFAVSGRDVLLLCTCDLYTRRVLSVAVARLSPLHVMTTYL
jgi:hypothetical protein